MKNFIISLKSKDDKFLFDVEGTIDFKLSSKDNGIRLVSTPIVVIKKLIVCEDMSDKRVYSIIEYALQATMYRISKTFQTMEYGEIHVSYFNKEDLNAKI